MISIDFFKFTGHEMLTALLDDNDQAVFHYLRELNVEDHDDVKSGYKISLVCMSLICPMLSSIVPLQLQFVSYLFEFLR